MEQELVNRLVLLGVAIVSTSAITLLNLKTSGKWLKRFTYWGIWAGLGLGIYSVVLVMAAAS